jgi:predicted amidohydrolase YtcJ
VILANGLIRTLDPQVPTQRALAVAGDKVAGGVGVHETALASPEVLDLGGRVVLPGFTDSHVHFPTWALARDEVKLDGCASLEEALARIRAASAAPGKWLRGYGWRSGDWQPQQEPTRADLDAITGNAPAAMIAKDYHSIWLNTAALVLAGGDLDVDGGVVERDAHGEPTGVLREEAAWRFKDRHMTLPDDDYLVAMRAGIKLANARGVTAVHDKDGWLGALRLWQQLEERGSLSLRVWQSIPHDRLEEAVAVGLRSGFGSPHLRVGYLKVFMDGTLGSQTARMLDGSGVQITSRDELADIVRRGAEAGFPVAVHAIGDRANREALDAFEQTKDAWGPRGLRQRIEHAQLLAPEDLPRFGQIGVACSVQFSHAPSDRDLADEFWAGKTDGAYAFRSLLDSWHPEQCLTVDEAFHATCVAPAWLARDERRRGTLIPGRDADLVVLDRDPWEDLDAQVVATMVAGRWVHNPPPWE